jgi:hypothetical protein
MILLLMVPANVLGTPRLEARWSHNPVRPGKPFQLNVTARWEGNAGLYAVRPPQADLPEGLVGGPVSSRSSREGSENVIRFQQEMSAPESGLIPAFPLRLEVFEAGHEEPYEKMLDTEPLRVDIPRWKGIPLATIFPGTGLLALLIFGVILWALTKKRRRACSAEGEGKVDSVSISDLGEKLNACRVRGDTLGFFEAALEIHQYVEEKETPESREIRDRLEQTRYGNLRLSGEEMDAWHRRLKRLMAPGGKA